VARSTLTATRDGDGYILIGEKNWISNRGVADLYALFARIGEAPGAKGLSAFIVTPDLPGFQVAERLETIAPQSLATLRFTVCRVPAGRSTSMPRPC
jgi:acyl-CoA dehydrogenase